MHNKKFKKCVVSSLCDETKLQEENEGVWKWKVYSCMLILLCDLIAFLYFLIVLSSSLPNLMPCRYANMLCFTFLM